MPAKKSVAARIIRGLFMGITIGVGGGIGVYFLTSAFNKIACSTIVNPIATLFLVLGVTITAAIGIELSKELEEG
ncbi:MAG: hypothetical protein GXO32_05245 [Crenarchaeota archaeon]|nr:hypothetical protein [Thermoproteota archaeon]